MKTIKQIYIIDAPVEKVWDALTNPKTINKWGGGPARMSDEVGFEFSLWNNWMYGKNTEVIKNKLLRQNWYGGENWDKPSILTFKLIEKNGKTEVDLLHEKVPGEDAEDIEDGWKKYYMGPLKDLLEK